MPAADCKTLAAKISQAVGIPLGTRVGKPGLSGIDGNACLMSGRASGLTASFADVQNQLNAVFADWSALSEFAADAGGSTQQGFAKASQRIVYQLTNDPPRGTCENVVVAACKVVIRPSRARCVNGRIPRHQCAVLTLRHPARAGACRAQAATERRPADLFGLISRDYFRPAPSLRLGPAGRC
jgi:hypothetical protein